jgi:hypothetical protein
MVSVSAMPSAPASRANASALGSMWGKGLEWSAIASMSKRTAPGICPARYSAPASRCNAGR